MPGMTLVIFGALGHVDRYLEKTHRKAALHWPKYVVDTVYPFPKWWPSSAVIV